MPHAATYDVRLLIGYEYEYPAAASRSLLRLMPLIRPGQALISGLVNTDPRPDFRQDFVDFFGNPTTEIVFERALEKIEFRFAGRVQVAPPETALDFSCALSALPAEIAGQLAAGPASPHHFLGESPRIALARDFAEFARKVVGGAEVSVRAAAVAICDALHELFDFDPTATDVRTAPIDAFRKRRGVCQDMSHVAIACLRAIGIPAGYVSGFLRTIPPKGKPRLEGADAMHAWVRAWCGAETGWIEIDPTNAILAGPDHIAVAIGRDYSDIAPIKGALRSVGSHHTFQKVDVIPLIAR